MKIPTLLGFAFIITLIALGGLYYYYTPTSSPEQNMNQISNLEVVNVSNTSATVVWQTSMPAVGEVLYGENESLSQKGKDNRDSNIARARMIHFVTLNYLKPNTKYYAKAKNDGEDFMPKALEFKTGNAPEPEDDFSYSFIRPLKGTILNTNLNPIDESLVFVEIPGATKLATFSSTAGNFLMPLKTVLNKDLDKIFVIPENTLAQVNVVKGSLKSEVKIKISAKTVNLPPVTIGSNLDLEKFEPQPIKQITFSTVPSFGGDFNGDQRINSLDLALLKEAAENSGNTQSNFDINKDGIVDEDDVNEFSKNLEGD